MSKPKALTKVSTAHQFIETMNRASVFRASIMAEIDNCEDADRLAHLTNCFQSLSLDLADDIDFAKALSDDLKAEKGKVEAAIKALQAHHDSLELVHTKLKERAREVIEAQPDRHRFDSYGKKLSLGNNGGVPKLLTDYDEGLARKHFSNVLSPDNPMPPEEYVEVVQFFALNTAKLRADLEAGAQIPWARLERGQRIYGL